MARNSTPRRRSTPFVPHPPRISAVFYAAVVVALVPALLAAVAWSLQHGSLDLAIARDFFDDGSGSFAWRRSVWLEVLGHHGARSLPIIIGALTLTAGAAGYALDALRPWRSILLALGSAMVLGPLAVSILKMLTSQHCPAEMSVFGGIVDYDANQHAPFFAVNRASAGRCLPSGHAGGGYGLLALFFAGWAAGRPAWRWSGLAIGLATGLTFSAVRVMQGAHFASATLWSAAVDWTVAALLFMPLICGPRRPSAEPEGTSSFGGSGESGHAQPPSRTRRAGLFDLEGLVPGRRLVEAGSDLGPPWP